MKIRIYPTVWRKNNQGNNFHLKLGSFTGTRDMLQTCPSFDCHSFRLMQSHLMDQRFQEVEDLGKWIGGYLASKPASFYREDFHNLPDKCENNWFFLYSCYFICNATHRYVDRTSWLMIIYYFLLDVCWTFCGCSTKIEERISGIGLEQTFAWKFHGRKRTSFLSQSNILASCT